MIQAGRLQLVRCNHAGNLRGSARPDRPTRPVNVTQVRRNHGIIRISPARCGQRHRNQSEDTLALNEIVTQICFHAPASRPLADCFHSIHKRSAWMFGSGPDRVRSIQ